MSKKNRGFFIWFAIWLLRIVVSLIISSVAVVIAYKWVAPPITFTMIERRMAATDSSPEFLYEWIPIEEVSPFVPLAVVASEDQLFPVHSGFDLKAIEKALESNKKTNRIRGASTISQQVAKNLFLWQGRSWVRKGLEVYFTVLIEFFWDKERILEMYINVAEMGDMTFGVGAVATRYLKKLPFKITRHESALIAAVLPNPLKYKIAQPSRYVLGRQKWVIRQMGLLGGPTYLDDVFGIQKAEPKKSPKSKSSKKEKSAP